MAVIRILGRTVVVALFICTLVVVAFAQAPPAQTPTVVVNNQALVNGNLTIEQVTVPQQAFLVIQRDLSGAAESILGRVALVTGTTENVVIRLDAAVAPGEQLYAALYLDAAPVGVFEAPGADTLFLVNNQPVAQPFTITAENASPVQATLTPTQTQQVQPITQPTVQPTVTVTALVTIPVNLTATATPTVLLVVSPTLVSTPPATTPAVTQPITQTADQTSTQPITQPVAQPTSPLPTPMPIAPTPVPMVAPTLAPTLEPPATPTSPPATPVSMATPTQTPTGQLFFPQLIQPLTPTPAAMPMTGANGTATLPTTLLIGALTFGLLIGGDRLRKRWRGPKEP